jgi:hypothetical protein
MLDPGCPRQFGQVGSGCFGHEANDAVFHKEAQALPRLRTFADDENGAAVHLVESRKDESALPSEPVSPLKLVSNIGVHSPSNSILCAHEG